MIWFFLRYIKKTTLIIKQVRAIQNFRSPTNPKEPTGSATVTVVVRDVNDVTPTFDRPSYNETVSETASPETIITTIRVSTFSLFSSDKLLRMLSNGSD